MTNQSGRPVQRADFNDRWREAVRQAGLPERTRFHDLKHFYTSTLGASGRHDPKTVQALSRHGEFSETWDTYAHPPLAVEGVTVTTFSSVFDRNGSGSTGVPGDAAGLSRGRSVVPGSASTRRVHTGLDRAPI